MAIFLPDQALLDDKKRKDTLGVILESETAAHASSLRSA
jgi:hypothetical protein